MAYKAVYLDIIFVFNLSPFLLSVNTQAHGKQFKVSQIAFRETIVDCPRWCIKCLLLQSRWCYF